MLPKISAALSKFVSPIATSTSEHGRRGAARDPEQRRRGQKRRGPPPPGSFTAFEPPADLANQPPLPASAKPPLSADLDIGADPVAAGNSALTPGQTLLQLMAALKLTRGISKLFVAIAYRSGARGQKASGVAQKGAVLDQKAE